MTFFVFGLAEASDSAKLIDSKRVYLLVQDVSSDTVVGLEWLFRGLKLGQDKEWHSLWT